MRVLVTGAAGFLGRHLMARLAALGHEAVGIDARAAPGVAVGDITDAAAMGRAARGVDAVIHAAALSGLWARDPGAFDRVNHQGTRTVLWAAAEAGASRAVLVSSYTTLITGGRRSPARRVDERDEHPPQALLGPYPAAKRRAELAAVAAPIPTVIVLPTMPIGPGDVGPTPPGRLLCDLARGRLPAMLAGTWDLVDVRAVADSTIAGLSRGTPGQRYLLGGEGLDTDAFMALFAQVSGVRPPRARAPYGLALGVARIEAAVARLTGRAPSAPLTGVRLGAPRLWFDSSRARTELGHEPGPTARAITDALTWFRAEGRI